MSKKNSILNEAGITTEGKLVYKGVYRFFETNGVPLDVLFECIDKKDGVVSWVDFYKEAKYAGMEHDRILSKLEEAICDIWGKDFFKVVEGGLNSIFGVE